MEGGGVVIRHPVLDLVWPIKDKKYSHVVLIYYMTIHISYIKGSLAERLATMNAIRGVPTAQKYYDLKKTETEDISFDLMEIDHVLFGQPFSITVHIQVRATQF